MSKSHISSSGRTGLARWHIRHQSQCCINPKARKPTYDGIVSTPGFLSLQTSERPMFRANATDRASSMAEEDDSQQEARGTAP